MLNGSIADLGSQYVITLDAVNAGTGDPLAREEVQASSKEGVLNSLHQDRLQFAQEARRIAGLGARNYDNRLSKLPLHRWRRSRRSAWAT